MANNKWILDVLTDLKAFALANDLGVLAGQLDDTTLIAATEIASQAEKVREEGNASSSRSGHGTGGFGRHGHA
jgi:hypothetical protein